MDKGLDYAWGRPNLDTAWNAGYRFVSRYLSWLPNGKVIGEDEVTKLRTKGFHVALNWEFKATDALGGASAGRTQATEAVRQAKALAYPAGKTIYFSVDFDVTPAQADTVAAYIKAAGAVVRAAGYRIGAYGGYWALKRLFDAKLIDDGWQAYAWSRVKAGVNPGPNAVVVELRGVKYWFDTRSAMRQVHNGITVGGADCDENDRVGTTYLMGQSTAAPRPTLHRKWPSYMKPGNYFGLITGPAESHGGYYTNERPDIKAIQQRLIALGFVPGIHNTASSWADGKYEAETKAAVTRWQKAKYAKTTSRYGEVWSDDWAHLFTY